MRRFHFVSPSPAETRSYYVLAFGSFVGQVLAFWLAMTATNPGAGAIAVGAGFAVMVRFAVATWNFDTRRKRAGRALEVTKRGLKLPRADGRPELIEWRDVDAVKVRGGRLELGFNGRKWRVGAREIENGTAFIEEVARHTGKGNVIPLTPR